MGRLPSRTSLLLTAQSVGRSFRGNRHARAQWTEALRFEDCFWGVLAGGIKYAGIFSSVRRFNRNAAAGAAFDFLVVPSEAFLTLG
jgi:hypothetical protein